MSCDCTGYVYLFLFRNFHGKKFGGEFKMFIQLLILNLHLIHFKYIIVKI